MSTTCSSDGPEPGSPSVPPVARQAGVTEQVCQWLRLVPQTAPALLAVLFLLFGLFAVASLSLQMPPFENPDEPAHFLRAYQISQLVLIGHRTGPKDAGGMVDTGALQAFVPILFPPGGGDGKLTPAMLREAAAVVWSGTQAEASFPNTTRYPPLFYLPAAAAIRIGQLTHMTVVSTLHLARALTGGVAVLIGAAAIAAAGTAAPWLFLLLCLPASLGQIASPSQDSLMFVLSAAAVVPIAAALREDVAPSRLAFWGMVAALAAVVQARPPYAPLGLLLLLLPQPGLRQRLAGLGVVLTAGITWAVYAAIHAHVNFRGDIPPGSVVDGPTQIRQLMQAPWHLLTVLANTLQLWIWTLWDGVIGQLGWLDIIFPRGFYQAADVVMVLAALLCLRGQVSARRRIAGRAVRALGVLAAMALCGLGILLVQYITYTPVGLETVEGVEGRYFVPVLMFLVAALPLCWPPGRWTGAWTALFAVVAVFPLVSLAAALRMIVLRYFI